MHRSWLAIAASVAAVLLVLPMAAAPAGAGSFDTVLLSGVVTDFSGAPVAGTAV